jgi:hypothetical protein
MYMNVHGKQCNTYNIFKKFQEFTYDVLVYRTITIFLVTIAKLE